MKRILHSGEDPFADGERSPSSACRAVCTRVGPDLRWREDNATQGSKIVFTRVQCTRATLHARLHEGASRRSLDRRHVFIAMKVRRVLVKIDLSRSEERPAAP